MICKNADNSREIMKTFYTIICLLCFTFSVSALEFDIPENDEIRIKYKELIFGPTYKIIQFTKIYEVMQFNLHDVVVRNLVNEDSVYLIFENKLPGVDSSFTAGTYIIRRNRENGRFVEARVRLKNRSDTSLKFYPDNGRSRMDIYLFNTKVFENVLIPMGFEELLLQPIQKIISLTQHTIDWDLLFVKGDPLFYQDIVTMLAALRAEIPFLNDSEDGAMDKNGRLVSIDNLELQQGGGFNCSGFAKWIVDGLLHPKTGNYLEINTLKEKHLDVRGSSFTLRYEDDRDPFFGLDWTRNLAMAAGGKNDDPERYDVTELSFFQYIEDAGYKMDNIDLVLYQLAVREPGNFYLGSVNGEYGSDPILRQHYHIVILFPYFNKDGEFMVSVLERNAETTLSAVKLRYPGEFIHIVRISSSPDFELPDQGQGLRLFR